MGPFLLQPKCFLGTTTLLELASEFKSLYYSSLYVYAQLFQVTEIN